MLFSRHDLENFSISAIFIILNKGTWKEIVLGLEANDKEIKMISGHHEREMKDLNTKKEKMKSLKNN